MFGQESYKTRLLCSSRRAMSFKRVHYIIKGDPTT